MKYLYKIVEQKTLTVEFRIVQVIADPEITFERREFRKHKMMKDGNILIQVQQISVGGFKKKFQLHYNSLQIIFEIKMVPFNILSPKNKRISFKMQKAIKRNIIVICQQLDLIERKWLFAA